MTILAPELDPAERTPLALLLASVGFTFTTTAAGIPDCTPLLLERIATGRQPFPVLLAKQIQNLTGLDQGTLLSTTKFWTRNDDPMTRKAVPPDPLLGDPIPQNLTQSTQQLVFPAPPPSVPELWVVGDGLGAASAPGAQAINRNTGQVVAQVSFVDTIAPVEIAFDGSVLWTFANGLSGPNSFNATIDPDAGVLIAETDAQHTAFLGVCFEPVTSTIWACSSTSTSLYRYDSAGLPDASVPLAAGPGFEARDVLAFHGLLYVTGVFPTGVPATPFEGRVFEVDPVGLTLLRSSTGLDLGNVLGLAVDEAGNLWTVSRAGGGTIPPLLAKTPILSFVSAQVPLISDPDTLTDPQWVEFLFGSVWFTDSTAPNGRLVEVDAGGNVLQSRTFASGSAVGHVVSDGKFLWYADKAGGLVHLLDPGDASASPFTVAVGGAPDGLLVLA